MVFGSRTDRVGANFTPKQIAESELLTGQEKLDLLNELKAKVTGTEENDEDYGFSPEEIDAAIVEVNRRSEGTNGGGLNISFGGDDA